MRSTKLIRLAAAGLLTSTALTGAALAQSAPAPLFSSNDDNGVDWLSGLASFNLTEGYIGSGPGTVSMDRIWAQKAGWTDNWVGGLFRRTESGQEYYYVQFQGISEKFDYATGNGPFTNTKENGGTLVKTGGTSNKFLYTTANGTVIEFDPTGSTPNPSPTTSMSCPGATAGTCAIPIQITQPNGLKFYLDWTEDTSLGPDYFRLFTVRSSAGYRLEAEYASGSITSGGVLNPLWFRRTKIKFVNLAISSTVQSEINYTYDDGARTVDVSDPGGRVWRFTMDNSNRLTAIRRPGNTANNVTYTYAGLNGTIDTAVKDGVTTTYTRTTGPLGATFITSSNQLTPTQTVSRSGALSATSGLLTRFTNGVGKAWFYQYGGTSGVLLTKVTMPEGNYTNYTYDTRGNLLTTTSVAKPPNSAGLAPIVTTMEYPSCTTVNRSHCNKPDKIIDARGKATLITYDDTHGGILTIRPPQPSGGAQPQTRITYQTVTGPGSPGDAVTVPWKISACQTRAPDDCSGVNAADEARTEMLFNSNLVITSQTRRDGTGSVTSTVGFTPDARGNVTSVTDPLSNVWAYKYDAANQLVGTITPDPDAGGALKNRAVRITYRPDGQVTNQEVGNTVGQSDAAFAAMTVSENYETYYDSNSRAYMTRVRGGTSRYNQTQFSYDAVGRLDCTAVRMDRNEFTNDANLSACTLGANPTGPQDRIAKIVYDDAGQVLQQRSVIDTSGGEAADQTFTYTDNGRLSTLKDGENNLTTYVYDGQDRLSQTQYPNTTKGSGTSNASDYEQLTYENWTDTDPVTGGPRTDSTVTAFRTRANQSIAFSYDNMSRLVTKNLPGTEPDVTYGYDNLNRLTSASQTGINLTWTYDALSRQLTATAPHGTVCSEWDAAGRRTKLVYPGPTDCSGSLWMNYDYLTTGDMTKIRRNGAVSGSDVLATYAYDDIGRRASLKRAEDATKLTTYTYDAISRLASLTNVAGTDTLTIGNTYNPANKITTQSRSNDTYSYTPVPTGSTTYTTDGLNRVTAVNGSAVSYDSNQNLTSEPVNSKTYGYTSENLLVSASGGSSPASTLTYDPIQRLFMNQENVSGAAIRRTYDGLEPLTERDAAGNLLRRFVWGADEDEPLVWYEGSGSTDRRWLYADERGSIVRSSNDGETIVDKNKYDEFGVPKSANAGRWQYTGQAWLPELSAYYYKARVYDPHLGRFLQTDPISYDAGPNLYAYVGNDPINDTDPLGLDGEPSNPPGPTPSNPRDPRPECAFAVPENVCTGYAFGQRAWNLMPGRFRGRGIGPLLNTPTPGLPKRRMPTLPTWSIITGRASPCLSAVAGAAWKGLTDPGALVNDALSAGAFGVANASKIAAASYPASRALTLVKASGVGLVVGVGIQAVGGGIIGYATDSRCE